MAVSDPTIPHAPAGFNCLMVVKKYGSRVARCMTVSYGLTIGSTEDEAASRRVYYPLNEYVPAFDIGYVFVSKIERDAFSRWMSAYMQKVAANQAIGGYVYVQVPARNIAFNGVPLGPLVYGDTIPETPSYPLTVRYIGVSDPASAVGKTSLSGVSQFQLPSKDKTDAPYFYPAGKQVSGAASLQGTLYDPAPPKTAPSTKSSGGGGRRLLPMAW